MHQSIADRRVFNRLPIAGFSSAGSDRFLSAKPANASEPASRELVDLDHQLSGAGRASSTVSQTVPDCRSQSGKAVGPLLASELKPIFLFHPSVKIMRL